MTSYLSTAAVLAGEHRENVKQAISQRLYGISDCHGIRPLIFRSIGP